MPRASFFSGLIFDTDDDDDLFSSGSTIPIPSKAKMAVPKKRGSLSNVDLDQEKVQAFQ